MDLIIRSLRNSFDGLRHGFRAQRKVRLTLGALGLAIPVACVIAEGPWQWVALVAAVILSLTVELLNSCAEELCDHVTPENHPDIKAVKDMGSAAVFGAHLIGVLIWIAAVLDRMRFF
jgi:diacylglycerol kinase (ATP)